MDNASEQPSASGANPTWTAFDQLDTLVRVTTVQAWIYLAVLFAVGVGVDRLRVPLQSADEGQRRGDPADREGPAGPGAGPGDRPAGRARPGRGLGRCRRRIGRIAQDELEDRIQRGQAKLADLGRQDRELTQFEETERESKEAAMARVKEAVLIAQARRPRKAEDRRAGRRRRQPPAGREASGRPRAAGVAREVLRRPRRPEQGPSRDWRSWSWTA